jgi:hypothetical protein
VGSRCSRAHTSLPQPTDAPCLCAAISLPLSVCRRAYEQLLPYFEDMLESQGWLDTLEKSDKILEYIDTSKDTMRGRRVAARMEGCSGAAQLRPRVRCSCALSRCCCAFRCAR